MADKLDHERRSANMAKVRGKNTAPELRVRRIAHRMGLRFRLHRKDLPGKPDLVFAKHRLAVFVHGCFWHRHPNCARASTPATRTEFWQTKFDANVARDRRQQETLAASGWNVLVLWECDLKDDDAIAAALAEAVGRQSSGTPGTPSTTGSAVELRPPPSRPEIRRRPASAQGGRRRARAIPETS